MTDRREAVHADLPVRPRLTYVPAVRVGATVYLSGTTATDDNGQIVGPGDVGEQTRQIYRKFERILRSLGGSCRDIVSTTDYFIEMKNYSATADVRREVFGDSYPASTGVRVAELLRKGALIEVSAIAVLGSGASSP